MANLSLHEKKMLVRKTYPEKETLNLLILQCPNRPVSELIKEQFKSIKETPFVIEGKRWSKSETLSVEKKEGMNLAIEMAKANELLVPFVESKVELIKKHASLIFMIPDVERTEEEKAAAIKKEPQYASSLGPLSMNLKRLLADADTGYYYSYPKDFLDGCSYEEILELIDIDPNIMSLVKEEDYTKELLYYYLERMVKRNLEPTWLKVPEHLKDTVYWRSLCMVSPGHYAHVPKDIADEVITQKLFDYTMSREHRTYSQYITMAEHLPEKLQTAENYKKLILKHPYAAEKLPEHLRNDEFYKFVLTSTGNFMEHIDFNTASSEVLAEGFAKGGQLLFCDKKIPKGKWTEELAIAVARNYNRFSFIPKQFQTRKVAEEFLRKHCDIDQIPKSLHDEELYLHALRHNGYAFNQIPKAAKTESFYNLCKEERLLDVKYMPLEYLDEEYVIDKIKSGPCQIYSFDQIPEAFRTERVIKCFAEYQTRNRQIKKEYQTEENVKVLKEHWDFETRYAEAYFWSTIREDLRDMEALDKLATESGAIEILLTKEQIDKNLELHPTNVLFAPEWYLEEYVRGNKKEKLETNNNETTNVSKTLTETVDTNGSFTQMTIWDLLTA